jgi:acyl-CoA dehydrogenase
MIDFEPSEEQQLMRQAVAAFARANLEGRQREIEARRALSDDVRRAAHAMGLGGVELPAACGGQELGWVTATLIGEELGRVDAAAAAALAGPGAFGTALTELGSPEQQVAWLSPFFAPDAHDRYGAVAWSEKGPCRDHAGMSTRAERSARGWTLRGHKCFVHNAGLADRYLVFAQVAPEAGWSGLGAFVVAGDAPGLRVGERHDTLGLDAAHFAELTLDDVAVDDAARLVPGDIDAAIVRFFTKRALIAAARAVGLAQQAFDLARAWCDTRMAFGKPIGHFQAVAFNLADRLMDIEAARWMCWRAAWQWDAARPERECLRDSAYAAAQALEVALRTSDDCVSLHGGAGFIRDVLAEKLLRDARQLALCSPSAGQLDQLAAACDLGAPLDPALVFPTPEGQSVFV